MKTKTNLKAGGQCAATNQDGNKLIYEHKENGKLYCVYESKA